MSEETSSAIEPMSDDVAFLTNIWRECAEIDLTILRIKACAAIQKDSREKYTLTASINDREIFRKTIKVDVPNECFERTLTDVPVISPFADRAKLCVKGLRVTPQEFKCDIELHVRIIAPFPLGWQRVKVWKVRKRIATFADGIDAYFTDDEDTANLLDQPKD